MMTIIATKDIQYDANMMLLLLRESSDLYCNSYLCWWQQLWLQLWYELPAIHNSSQVGSSHQKPYPVTLPLVIKHQAVENPCWIEPFSTSRGGFTNARFDYEKLTPRLDGCNEYLSSPAYHVHIMAMSLESGSVVSLYYMCIGTSHNFENPSFTTWFPQWIDHELGVNLPIWEPTIYFCFVLIFHVIPLDPIHMHIYIYIHSSIYIYT